jgi:hypothetical protein
MSSVLIAILIIVVIASAIGAILYYAPFIPAPLKTWGVYVVGAVAIVLIVVELLKLLQSA